LRLRQCGMGERAYPGDAPFVTETVSSSLSSGGTGRERGIRHTPSTLSHMAQES
jgi:hypothetical protein